MEQAVKLNCGFSGLVNKPKHSVTDYTKDKDIVEYEEQEYVEKIGEGDTDFVVKSRVVEKSRINRQQYIESFSDEVGIHNILKKVQLTGDENLLKQRADAPFFDATQFQNGRSDLVNSVSKGVEAFDNLPPDIKGKMSLEEFVNKFGQKEFDSYIKNKVDAILAAKEKKGDGE